MASTLVTPTIKLLNGDLYSIEADPAKSIDHIRFQLAALYPDVFPIHRVHLVDADETNPPLTDASILLATIKPYNGPSLESVREETFSIPHGTQTRYALLRHWTFVIRDNIPVHLYRYEAYGADENDAPFYQLTADEVDTFADFRPSQWTFFDQINYQLAPPNQPAFRLRYHEKYLIYRTVIVAENDIERIHSTESPSALLLTPNHCECGVPLDRREPDHDTSEDHMYALLLQAAWRTSVNDYVASWR
jgi:hypothetical protein